ncbi:hypothetical protein ACH42_10780 [Endozoicomonas sp. (ex Bugula neritina AB1)]|nr:hypothetical protein ACH42_10780 [Endozoicomonas sp. (ex Bugula neritina AB1)]
MRFLLLPFIILPILEMVVLIEVGGAIGALNTVALVFLGAFIGIQVIRQQGFSTMVKAQQKMAAGELPAGEMAEAFMIAIGGLFMVIPGFITDVLGVLLLIPSVRRWLLRRMIASGRWRVQQTEIYQGEYHREQPWESDQDKINHTVDGEYKRNDRSEK